MRAFVAILGLLVFAAVVLAGEDALKGDAKRLYESAVRTARASRFRERDEERLRKKMAEVADDDLDRIVVKLRDEPDEKAKTLDEVLAVLEGELFLRRYGDEVAEYLPDLSERLRTEDPAKMEETIVAGLALEDFRLAKDLVRRWWKGTGKQVRIRVVKAIAALVNFGAGDDELEKTFTGLLADEDPAVRAIACREGFGMRHSPIFPWALGHLDDGVKGEAKVGEALVTLIPGQEALVGLSELTHIQRELLYRQYRELSPAQKESLVGMFRAWWKDQQETFPAVGFREAAFRPRPSEEKSVVVAKGKTAGTVNLWSGLDRTRIRVHVDELEAVPVTFLDWVVNFHVRYMASGMRMDDGEGYRRYHPVGELYILPRKKIGCYVLVFQVLFGNRVKIYLRFHDPIRLE